MSTRDARGRERDERPWGSYVVLDDEEATHKVKRIVVDPGQRLSYQRHRWRAEHWFVVAGRGRAIIDDVAHDLVAGASVDILVGQAHRAENPGNEPLVFVEVQTGTSFGEDDIERLSDDYGRAG